MRGRVTDCRLLHLCCESCERSICDFLTHMYWDAGEDGIVCNMSLVQLLSTPSHASTTRYGSIRATPSPLFAGTKSGNSHKTSDVTRRHTQYSRVMGTRHSKLHIEADI